jgi:PAS domain S-box-containing protein
LKNEQLYQAIFENSEEGIWVIDRSGKTLMVNDKICELLNYSSEEMVGKTIFDFMDARWKQEAVNQIERRKKGVSEHHEFVLQKKDGSRIWVDLASSPLKDQEGEYIGGLALVSDISKTKREEVLLSAQKNIFELMAKGGSLQDALGVLINGIEKVIDGVIGSVLLLDEEEQRITTGAAPHLPVEFTEAINHAPIGPKAGSCGTAMYFKKIIIVEDIAHDELWEDYRESALAHGLKACWSNPIISHTGKVLGTFAMYFKEVRKPYPEELRLVEDFSAAARLSIEYLRIREQERNLKIQTSLLAEIRETLVETLNYRKVLRKIPALLSKEYADWSVISLEDEEGILEIIAVEGRNSEQKEKLEKLVGARPNREAAQGLARAMRERKPLLYSKITLDDLRASSPAVGFTQPRYLNYILDIGVTSYMVTPIIVRDAVIGGISVFSSNPNRLFNNDDLNFLEQMAVSCSMAVDNAILYGDSQKSIQSREEFISIASHELRTPLTSLKLRIDLLTKMLHRGNFPEEMKQALFPVISEIKPDLNKFTKLIEMLLDISKINSSKMFLSLDKSNITSILEEELGRIKSEFQSQRIPFESFIQKDLIGECDVTRLQQVVMNLTMNALKFSNNKPVEFHAKRDDNNLVLVVKDQGIGISQEDIRRIYRPFERAVSDKHFGGLGLGLYITHQIVEAYNGQIKVESELGKGTFFEVRLPIFTVSQQIS